MRDQTEVRQRQRNQLRLALLDARKTSLAPPSRVPLSQWVEEEYYLSSESSSLPGKYRFDLVPFQREVFDATTDPEIRKVVVMACSQLLKTQLLLCYLTYTARNNPGPAMVVNATNKMTQRFSKNRLDVAFRDNGVQESSTPLRTTGRAMGGTMSVWRKAYPGGSVLLSTAGSTSDLAALPIRDLLCDEVDRYTTTDEGSAIDIAYKRTTTFWDRKIILTSSPGDEALSRIYREYMSGDQREWYVPCHNCGFEQVLVWEQVKWEKPQEAYYTCIKCQSKWTNVQKDTNVRKGFWKQAKPHRPTASFKISALNSPWVSLAELVEEFLQASNDIEELRVFFNTRLSEAWKDSSEGVKDIRFINRVEKYSDNIPNNVLLITAGVDVQGDRLEMEIVGWGVGDESWSLEYHVIHGDPSTSMPWNELSNHVRKRFTREDGVELYLHCMAVDCNYLTQDVLIFTNKYESKGVIAVRGVSGFDRPIFYNKPSRSKYSRYKYYNVGVDVAKQRFYRQLGISEPGSGYCHFPDTRDDDYFTQLTSETLVTRWKRGRSTKGWQKREAHLRGEALDCRVYAIAARFTFTVDMERRDDVLKEKQKKIEEVNKPREKPADTKSTSKPINIRNQRVKRKSRLLQGLGL